MTAPPMRTRSVAADTRLDVLPRVAQSECSDLTATTPRVLGDDLPHPNGRDRDDNADDNDPADDDA